jgi:ligand-binding sensor domain-containing protein
MRSQLHLIALLFILPGTLLGQLGWTVYDADNAQLGTGAYGGLVIDDDGQIWAGGGYKGVSMFNGSSWTHYTTFNSDLPTTSIYDMEVDDDGNVWVAHYEGLSRFSGPSIMNYDNTNTAMPGESAYMIEKAPNGDLWIATSTGSFGYEGITIHNGSTWTNLTGYPSQIDGDEFPDVAFTSTGEAWIAGSGITRYNGTVFNFYPYATTGLWSSGAVAVDASGNVWAGGFAGLLKYNGSWTMQLNTSFGFPENVLYYCIHPAGNYLWIGTSQGLLKYNRTSGIIEANYKDTNSPLPTNGVFQIAEDDNGMLWLATIGAVVKMDPSAVVSVQELSSRPVMNIHPNPSEGFINVMVTEDLGSDLAVQVVDALGRTIITQKMNGAPQLKLDLSTCAAGSYVVRLCEGDAMLGAERVMLR